MRKGLAPDLLRQVVAADVSKLPAYVGVPSQEGGYVLLRISKVVEAEASERASDAGAARRGGPGRGAVPGVRRQPAQPRRHRAEEPYPAGGEEVASPRPADHVAEAGIDVDDLAGDAGGQVGQQERRGVADVLGRHVAPQRRVLLDELQDLAEAR